MSRIPLSPFVFPANGSEPGAPASRTASACAEHLPRPGEGDMMALGPAALFVVASLRVWAAPLMRPNERHPDWQGLFRLAAVAPHGLVGFDVLMTVIGAHARRPIDVHCCACPVLGEDERSMLRLVAALQAGMTTEAVMVLADWLPEDVIVPALTGARQFAAEMSRASLMLLPPAMTIQ